jgi:hypothetical protein
MKRRAENARPKMAVGRGGISSSGARRSQCAREAQIAPRHIAALVIGTSIAVVGFHHALRRTVVWPRLFDSSLVTCVTNAQRIRRGYVDRFGSSGMRMTFAVAAVPIGVAFAIGVGGSNRARTRVP